MNKRIIALLLVLAITLAPIAAFASVPGGYVNNIWKKGDKNEEVRKIQQKLISLGYLSGKADASFGGKTKTALETFQRANAIHSYESDAYGTASYFTQKILFSDFAVPYYMSGTQYNRYVVRADEAPSVRTGSYVRDGKLIFTLNNPSPKAINGLVVTYWIVNSKGKRVQGNQWRWCVWDQLNIGANSSAELNMGLIADYLKGNQIRWCVSEVYYSNNEVLICDEANRNGYERSYYTTYY